MSGFEALLTVLPPSVNTVVATETTKQFDFGRNWRRRIVPLLDDPLVESSLTLGMALLDRRYEPGMPPWLLGRSGRNAKPNTVSWYQPEGRCHHIAPFAWAIGKKLYPKTSWGFLTGLFHTVVIGYEADWRKPDWVFDILNFRQCSARQSLQFTQSGGTEFFGSLERFAASFCERSGQAYEYLRTELGDLLGCR